MTRAVALAVLAVLLAAAPAAGQTLGLPEGPIRLVDRRQGDFAARGQVTVAFTRDGARGSITYGPAARGTVSTAEIATRSGRYRSLNLFAADGLGATTIAQVTRTAADGTVRRCTDARNERFGGVADGPRRELAITLPPRALLTRCGGPTEAELAGALPSLRLPSDGLPLGRRILDLRGERPFAAGAVSGTVRSSLVLRLTGVRRQGGRAQPSAVDLLAGFRSVRLARSEGTVALDLTVAAGGGECEGLDLCGATTTQELSLAGARGSGALRLGRRSASGYLITAGATSRTMLRRPDGSQCVGGPAATPLALELRPLRGGRIATGLTLLDPTATGLSGCPSPAPADVGLPRRFAAGSIERSALQRPEVTLRLRGAGSFAGPLGAGRAHGELVVVLRRAA